MPGSVHPEVHAQLEGAGLRAELDERQEKIGYKIREAQLQKIPYMLVIGGREAEAGTAAVRVLPPGSRIATSRGGMAAIIEPARG